MSKAPSANPATPNAAMCLISVGDMLPADWYYGSLTKHSLQPIDSADCALAAVLAWDQTHNGSQVNMFESPATAAVGSALHRS